MGSEDDDAPAGTAWIVVILIFVGISGGLGLAGVILPEWVRFECHIKDNATTALETNSFHVKGKVGLWKLCVNYDFVTNNTILEASCSTFDTNSPAMERPEWVSQLAWQAMSGVTANCLTILLLLGFAASRLPIRRQGAVGFAAACGGIAAFYLVALIVNYSGEFAMLETADDIHCLHPVVFKGTSFHLVGGACASLTVGTVASLIAAGLSPASEPRSTHWTPNNQPEGQRQGPEKKYILPGALEHFNPAGPWDDTDDDSVVSRGAKSMSTRGDTYM